MTIRILVVDDHHVIRAGLCTMLNTEPGLEVVGEAGSGEEALELVKSLSPDMVLMDLSMPGMGGLEANRQLAELKLPVRVLILTMYEDSSLLREAIRDGASGYILKQAVKSELIHAIRVVMNGDLYVHPRLARALLSSDPATPSPSSTQVDPLTDREMDVLKLIAKGYTNSQIAQSLYISVRTVEFHRGNLMSKLNANSRVDLVRYAAEHGIFD